MKNHSVKLTTLTIAMLSSFHASAALYKIVEVTPSESSSLYNSSYGTAIEAVASGFTDSDNCFSTSCGDTDYSLAGETRWASKTESGELVDGISFREEVPFGINDTFSLITTNSGNTASTSSSFDSFCSDYLGYSYCGSWATTFFEEWTRELDKTNPLNSYGFYENSGTSSDVNNGSTNTSSNTVVTGLKNGASSESDVVGFDITTGSKRIATSINPLSNLSITLNSSNGARIFGYKDSYYFGSVLTAQTNDNGTFYSSKGAIWYGSYGSSEVANVPSWGSTTSSFTTAIDDNQIAQGSIRGIYVSGSTLYGVGYTTYDSSDHFMGATVFEYDVSGTPSYSTHVQVTDESLGDDDRYVRTLLTGVNDNGVAIGEAKSRLSNSGSYANQLFVVPDVTSPNSNVDIFSSNIINNISSAGGHANAINDWNEVVGQIDVDSVREVNGKARRKRGFIYPYYDSSTSSSVKTHISSIFNNKAWLLDNLTNGGTNSSANNAYRILSANDINDAGVIAATAIKCTGGYNSTTIDASCSSSESTVAVKLIPINGATSSDISARGYETTSIERKGASFGFLGLAGLFGLLIYRRKK